MANLSKEATDLLEHMGFISCAFLDPCPEVQELFRHGYLEAVTSRWLDCIDWEAQITRQGIAVARRLH